MLRYSPYLTYTLSIELHAADHFIAMFLRTDDHTSQCVQLCLVTS